jgi:hypothetical protein
MRTTAFKSPALQTIQTSLIPDPNSDILTYENVDLPMLPSKNTVDNQYPKSNGLQTARASILPISGGYLLFGFGALLFYFTVMRPN